MEREHPSPSRANPRLHAAQQYIDAGFPVVLLRPNDKRPLLKGRFAEQAITTHAEAVRLWSRYPLANVGIATGLPFPDKRHTLAVLDLDRRNGGSFEAVAELALPATLAARTASGGYHLYYRVPAGELVRNSASALALGLDVRGRGGYVVAPGSTIDAHAYEWVEPLTPMAVIAAELLTASRRNGGARIGRYEAREGVAKGGRHYELVRYAGWLRTQGYQTADEIYAALCDLNETFRPPADDPAGIWKIAEDAEGWDS